MFIVDWIESGLRIFSSRGWTMIFVVLLAFVFVLLAFFLRKGKYPNLTAHAPAILASLGILGTFIGIVVGLLDFDPQQLDESIGGLLGGLKTAFFTSILGIFAGLIFRFAERRFKGDILNDEQSEISPEDIAKILNEQKDLMQDMRDAIASPEESSLAGQLKLLRTDLTDRHKENTSFQERFEAELWQRLQAFAEMLSKSATEQVIKALEAVIADFNRNLTEQFGENFKKLDTSVQKLVEWQEGYRRLLEELHALYDQSVQKITTIESAIAQIAEYSAGIPKAMEPLTEVIETVRFQIEELERHLVTFKELRDQAVEALPQTQSHVEAMAQDMREAVRVASENLTTLQRDSKQQLDRLAQAGQKVQDGILMAQDRVSDSIRGMQTRVENVQKEILDRQRETTEKVVQTMLDETQKAVSRTGEGINKQMESLDKAVEAELNRVVQMLGTGLGQIAGQIIDEYERLRDASGQNGR